MHMVPANPDNPANLETHPDGAAVPEFNIDDVNAAIIEDCKRYEEKSSFPVVNEEPYLEQTGSCTMKLNKGCSCEVLSEPIVRQIPDGYFENLQQFMQDIDDSVSHPTCSTDDSINFDTARFDEAIGGACHDHNELRRKKRHGAAISKRDDFAYYITDTDNLRWKLSWDDGSGKCALKCEDVFKQMLYCDKCRWWGGAAKKGSVPTECG
ncbi:hypothetical protein K458DRAFT_432581 [Lentithecium fluviatile CBS 122367]|uniref:Uncharacterized protein n=1 Tax=Lentithecium fluviatile CBS 122367 TaxID=1168545 RepID=A0A6G1IXA2_9PLEO|nr:hypothetical protein K458DRAFT_432581 [Lentithecium fluviatile CBS 122367]